jgi:hypothetical protein
VANESDRIARTLEAPITSSVKCRLGRAARRPRGLKVDDGITYFAPFRIPIGRDLNAAEPSLTWLRIFATAQMALTVQNL